jgi:hypothetical protein
MNLLDARAVCVLKGKPSDFAHFLNEINIFAILCQLHYFLVEHKTDLDQTERILVFLVYRLFD